jgi:hypothetical protein
VSCSWTAIFFPATEYFHNGPTVFCCHKLLTVGRQLQKHAHVAPKFCQQLTSLNAGVFSYCRKFHLTDTRLITDK